MQSISIMNPALPFTPGDHRRWAALPGSGLSLALAGVATKHSGPVVVITANTEEADAIRRELGFFCPDDGSIPMYALPDWETLPYDNFSAHQDIVSDRLSTLANLPGLKRGILSSR